MEEVEAKEGDFFEGVLLETCRDNQVTRPRVKPVEFLPRDLRVEFPRDLRERNPIGTRFRANVHVRQKHDSFGRPNGPLYLRAENRSIYRVALPATDKVLIARQKLGTISGRAYEYFWVRSAPATRRAHFYSLRERAYIAAVDSVGTTVTESVRRERSRIIADYVRLRADGNCEGCETPAPFLRRNNQPYLEIHHIISLASGGADSPRNIAAVCPNCHARVTHGRDGHEYNSTIGERIAQLEGSLEK
jgi:5-methylcytosine-specific restriction endonuclease McrA